MKEKEEKRRFKQLCENERLAIGIYLSEGLSISAIAKKLGRARSTIRRELVRGCVCENGSESTSYDFKAAQANADELAHNKGRKIKLDASTAEVLSHLIKNEGYSPYAALEVGKNRDILGTLVCVQTLYNYLHRQQVLDVESDELPYGFYVKKAVRVPFSERERSAKTKEGMSIDDRPKSVLTRSEFGHWEGDTVCGKQGTAGVFLTMIERKTRFFVSVWLPNRRQSSIVNGFDAIEEKFGSAMFAKCFKSITFDNGTEFDDTDAISASVNEQNEKRIKQIYFCHPYCSSERGSNEVVHKFLRRKWAKGEPLSNVDSVQYGRYVDWINHYPRKLHQGACAADCFVSEVLKL